MISARVQTESQVIQWFEVLLAADHFGVSPQAMLYQMQNLGIVTNNERAMLNDGLDESRRALFDELHEASFHPIDDKEINKFFVALGVEAFRRQIISSQKLEELAELVGREKYLQQLMEISNKEGATHHRKHKGDAR